MKKGFSLAELLVVVAIFLIITSVVLINQNRFSSDTNITNLAYQVALSIREAQVYGISVRGNTAAQGTTNPFDTAYGISFNQATTTSFLFFADVAKNGEYNAGIDPVIKTFKVENGIKLKSMSATPLGEVPIIADVTFRRPNPEAIIKVRYANSSICSSTPENCNKSTLQITFVSALGDRQAAVTVTQTGQIYVN